MWIKYVNGIGHVENFRECVNAVWKKWTIIMILGLYKSTSTVLIHTLIEVNQTSGH